MENGSLFWDKIIDLFKRLGLTYISEVGAMLILLAVCFVLLFLLWLVFRKARLWYWKTDIQIDALKSIDARLHNVEEKLSQRAGLDADEAEVEADGEIIIPCDEEPSQETARTAWERDGLTVVGKSGRIYTEAELEIQIRE
jgi:hypothetical protein